MLQTGKSCFGQQEAALQLGLCTNDLIHFQKWVSAHPLKELLSCLAVAKIRSWKTDEKAHFKLAQLWFGWTDVHLFTAQLVDISHVWKVSVQMLTGLKFANRDKRVVGNINNFKRPSLCVDIYRVRGGGTLERPLPPSSPRDTLAKAEEWGENKGGERKVVVVVRGTNEPRNGGSRQWHLLTHKTSHVTPKLKNTIK